MFLILFGKQEEKRKDIVVRNQFPCDIITEFKYNELIDFFQNKAVDKCNDLKNNESIMLRFDIFFFL